MTKPTVFRPHAETDPAELVLAGATGDVVAALILLDAHETPVSVAAVKTKSAKAVRLASGTSWC